MSLIIEVNKLCKCYKNIEAIKSVSLSIKPGEIYGLIGPDGSGKSSLMKVIAGVLSYESGQLNVFGQRVDSEASAEIIKAKIGFMPQGLGLNLYPELSIDENINFFADLRDVPLAEREERKALLMTMMQLTDFRHRAMKNLSGGMKQKLGLICTLIHKPELVILDEPTTGVDPVSRRDFWQILSYMVRHEKMTALVSTSYMDEAERFHTLSLFYQGKILAQGEPDQILDSIQGWVALVHSQALFVCVQALSTQFTQVNVFGKAIRVVAYDISREDFEHQIKSILARCPKSHYQIESIDLEDAFIGLLRPKNKDQTVKPALDATKPNSIFDTNTLMIEAQNLTRQFGTFTAVDQVSFSVQSGQIFGLLGANGAGKSTVIKMLTGLLKPSKGKGQVSGADLNSSGQKIKENIGYMSQSFSLYADLTVVENLKLYGQIYAVPKKKLAERIQWALQMGTLEQETHTLVGSLPMGLRQRLALGCALLHEPKVLFLDEPTSGIDPIGRQQFWTILVTLAKQSGVAILITTHYMSEAEHCDQLALMQAGKVIAQGSPTNLRQQVSDALGDVISMKVNQPYAALELLKKAHYDKAFLFGKRVHLFSSQVAQTQKKVLALLHQQAIEVLDVQHLPPTLEDVFVHFLESNKIQPTANLKPKESSSL